MSLDNFRNRTIIWDTVNKDFPQPIQIMQGDVNARTLLIKIIDNGLETDLSGHSLKLTYQYTDNSNSGFVMIPHKDLAKGEFILVIPAEMTKTGVIDANLILLNESLEQVIVSKSLTFISDNSTVTDLAQEVNNKIDDFTKLLLENMPQVMRSELNDLHTKTDSNTSNIELKANLSDMTSLQNEVEAFGITPERYTLVANNDTEKVQLAINDAINTQKELVLTKDYYIDSIEINKSLIIRGNGHTLYANKTGVEKFISIISTSHKEEEKTIQMYNLKVINKSDCVYGVFNDSCVLDMYQCLVEGFVTANVVGKPNAGGSFGNLNIDYLKSRVSENGILSLGATDHKINRYMGFNCMTHINGLGGNSYLFNSHGWNYNSDTKNWINGSKFVAVKDSCTMSNIYADTVEIAVDLTATNNLSWALIAIDNLGYFINKSTYPNQTGTNGVPTPKIFTDLDLFKGQLTVAGINVDFNGWLDKNNQIPKIASGKINTARMKFSGLNANGLNDAHGINVKISQVINDYLSYDATYLQYYNFKSLSQLGKTKMFVSFSLKKQAPSGVLISEITLNPTNITLSNVNIVTCDAIGWIADGTVYKLSARVSDDKIKIYNTSGQTITHGVEINVEVESYLC